MKKLIIILAILFSYNAYSQTHLPPVDNKVIYEATVTFPASAPYIFFQSSGTDSADYAQSKALLAASAFAAYVTADDLDTLRNSAKDTLFVITPDGDTLRYVNTAGTIAWNSFDRGPFPLLSEKLMFMGEVISSTVTNPKVGLMSKYWWVAPSTNASDNTAFLDMNEALQHDLSFAPAAIDTVLTAPLWLYGKLYGIWIHWGAEAKTIKYKLWMVRIDRRW